MNVEHMCAANISFWRAVPPQGFVALGDVVWQGHDKPPLDLILCVRSDLVEAAKVDEPCVWSSNEDSSGYARSSRLCIRNLSFPRERVIDGLLGGGSQMRAV